MKTERIVSFLWSVGHLEPYQKVLSQPVQLYNLWRHTNVFILLRWWFITNTDIRVQKKRFRT